MVMPSSDDYDYDYDYDHDHDHDHGYAFLRKPQKDPDGSLYRPLLPMSAKGFWGPGACPWPFRGPGGPELPAPFLVLFSAVKKEHP
ncbi:MAG: hypothetical protein FWH52_02415 [Synergistaceae bacterium]|nr:hypothetical protein [Synergistaceae bacterium]